MEKYMTSIKKYPKSVKNFQCLGPCMHPGTEALHPTYLSKITADHPFCPVTEWTHYDPKKQHTVVEYLDACVNPTGSEINNEDVIMNLLVPHLVFRPNDFLKVYYNIFTFESCIDWIEKNHFVTLTTKERLVNLALASYGKNIEILDQRFVDFFIDYLTNKYLYEIYEKIHMYIGVDKNGKNIELMKEHTLKKEDSMKDRLNYIVKVFIDRDEITKFSLRYLKHRKNLWEDINDHLHNMVLDFVEYINKKILITLGILSN